MGHPDGAHTHGSGGSGGTIALVIAAVILAGPVAAAVGELLRAVLIAAAVIAGLALAAGAALVAYRIRHGRTPQALTVHRARVAVRPQQPPPVPGQAAEPLPAPRRPAIGAPREVHLHFHGVSAEEITAIIERNRHESP